MFQNCVHIGSVAARHHAIPCGISHRFLQPCYGCRRDNFNINPYSCLLIGWPCIAAWIPSSDELACKSRKTRNVGQCPIDGRPAEYKWRPLFNAAKFGWRTLLECRAVTLPRRETRWNLHGCPKLTNRYQPVVSRSSPYCEDMWGDSAV